jgi:hypothetical protein
MFPFQTHQISSFQLLQLEPSFTTRRMMVRANFIANDRLQQCFCSIPSTSPCQLLQLEPSFTALLPPAFAEMLRKIRVWTAFSRGGEVLAQDKTGWGGARIGRITITFLPKHVSRLARLIHSASPMRVNAAHSRGW